MTPSVCCVCLYADRPQYIASMLASFRAQTYENKTLLIYDNGADPFAAELRRDEFLVRERLKGKTVGELRNYANSFAKADLLAHFDSDDYYHPARISEQVALLKSSKVELVGYREVLFWKEARLSLPVDGETWLYTNYDPRYAIGSSFLYRRSAWEKRLFEKFPMARGGTGEDEQWRPFIKSAGVSSLVDGYFTPSSEPRLIARIHGSNTADYDASLEAAKRQGNSPSWARAPHWDEYCRRVAG